MSIYLTWDIKIENLSDRPRRLKLVPYVEWVLDKPQSDRGHTQYCRLYPEVEYNAGINSVIAYHMNTKVTGILASKKTTEGFAPSRIEFIGRARSVWDPAMLT